jgi:hypothetical protein
MIFVYFVRNVFIDFRNFPGFRQKSLVFQVFYMILPKNEKCVKFVPTCI